MRIALRCIYYKAVTPSCDIIDMDDATWKEFLHTGGHKRKRDSPEAIGQRMAYESCEGSRLDSLGRTR